MKLQLKILTLNGRSPDEKKINSFLPDFSTFIFQYLALPENDVEEKVSTYLSIICIEDEKKGKTYKFRNNDILNHNFFSSTILVMKHFSPFISDCFSQVFKILY